MPSKQKELFQMIISKVCVKLWKTRCAIVQQTVVDSDMVIKRMLADIRRIGVKTFVGTCWIFDLMNVHRLMRYFQTELNNH